MQKQRVTNNVNTVFGIHKVPSDNQLRNLMDTLPPDHFFPVYRQIFSNLNQANYVEPFKEHLSSTLATLNILSFLIYTVLEYFDDRYRLVRQELGSRKTFFDDIRALTRYICFDSWHRLLETMMEGLEIPILTS
jgi:hypothetical protein